VGPFVAVDTNGKLVGGADILSIGAQPQVVVIVQSSEGIVPVKVEGEPLNTYVGGLLFFTTTNCTGQPYFNEGFTEFTPGVAFLLHDDSSGDIYFADTNFDPVPIDLGSRRTSLGVCQTKGGQQEPFWPATFVGSLSDEFAFPFEIVPASSIQIAAVPFLTRPSHWILALALVLAFGLYDRSRRNQHAA